MKGLDKGGKVSRDESYSRVPTLEFALAYEAIYGKPNRWREAASTRLSPSRFITAGLNIPQAAANGIRESMNR